MPTRPTLVQTLLNRPSQKYSVPNGQRQRQRRHSSDGVLPEVTERPRIRVNSLFVSSPPQTLINDIGHDTLLPGEDALYLGNIEYAGAAEECRSPRRVTSSRHMDTDDEAFYTPPESPLVESKEAQQSRPPPPPPPASHMSSSSLSSSCEDWDDLFSQELSGNTSLTSLSSSPSRSASPSGRLASTQTRKTSMTRRRTADNWSKDVRWLVPANAPSKTKHGASRVSQQDWLRPQLAYLHGIELVDVESEDEDEDEPRNGHRRTKRWKRMSAVWEEEEGQEDPGVSQSILPCISHHPNSLSFPSSNTVSMPVPLPVSQGNIPYGALQSLTLPHTFTTPEVSPKMPNGKVDLIAAGIAQSAISTIAITRHASSPTPGHLKPDVSAALGLTAHKKPPTYVPPHSVIVRVHAVGLDAVDLILVENRVAKKSGYDYVPGRSFVGQAIEVGWAAKKIAKGDWVCGLLDFKHAGALSQFVVMDSKRVTPIPVRCGSLTMDQIALLPLCGIPAHRAVNTLRYLPKSASILVLHAHAGSGLFATQELLSLGYTRVVAHISDRAMDQRVKSWGIDNIICGDAVELFEKEKGEPKFDAIIDTVGGKSVWQAARKVLKPSSHFITLIGDSAMQAPSTLSHLKASMRTLRRTWSKGIEYTWISPAADVDLQGDTVRDTLAAVVQLAQKRCVVPHVSGNVSADGIITAIEYEPYQQRVAAEFGGEDVIPVFGFTRKKIIEPYEWADDLTGVLESVGQGAEYDSFMLGHARRQTWAGTGNNKTEMLPRAVTKTELDFGSASSSDGEGSSAKRPTVDFINPPDSQPATPTGMPGPAGTAMHSVDTEGLVFHFERAAEAFTFNLSTGKRLLDGGCTAVVRLLD